MEIFARVLRDYRIPGNIIQNQIDLIRQEGYAMFRSPSIDGEKMTRLTTILEKTVMDTFFVDAGSFLAGMTLMELHLRKTTGTTIIAIVHDGHVIANPHSDFRIDGGDILVLFGSHAQLNAAMGLLNAKGPETGEPIRPLDRQEK